jgi:hypothetical protein
MPGAAHARRARLPESFLPSEIFTLGAKPVFLRDQRGEIRATPGGCFPNSCAPPTRHSLPSHAAHYPISA